MDKALLLSKEPLVGRRTSSRPLFVVAMIFQFGLTPGHAAGVGDPTTSGWLRLETNLNVTPEMLDSRWSSLVRLPSSAPDYSLSGANPSAAWGSMSHLPSLIEISPTHLAAAEPQVYVRPQFALGATSDSLRGWLRFAGINASTCTAPLMKMHSSFAGANAHAKVSVSARCSVH